MESSLVAITYFFSGFWVSHILRKYDASTLKIGVGNKAYGVDHCCQHTQLFDLLDGFAKMSTLGIRMLQ